MARQIERLRKRNETPRAINCWSEAITMARKNCATKNPVGANVTKAPEALLERLTPRRALLLICLLASLAYANALGGDFVFDDTEQIVENRDIRSWDNLTRAFTTHVWSFRERSGTLRIPFPPPYYRPIFTVMLTLEYHLFKTWPQGWHIVSLLLHILCSIGVYFVLLLLVRKKHVAVAAALIFAVFPVHAESVCWISGVTDPLFGVFYLASFYFYLKFRESSRRWFLTLSLITFTLSVFSKETALSLVILIFTYELIESRGRLKERVMRAARASAAHGAAVLVYLIPRYIVLGGLTWENPRAHKGPFLDVLLTLPSVMASYAAHLVWPIGLSAVYQSHFVTGVDSAEFILPAMGLALVAGSLIYFRKKVSREAWLALVMLFVPLLPALGIRQFAEEYLIADRYLYLPVAGWGLLISLGIEKLSRRFGKVSLMHPMDLGSAITMFLLLLLMLASTRENLNWADSYSLWSNVARVRPNLWIGHYNVGLVLLEKRQFEQARDVLLRAAEIEPSEPSIFDALGRAYDGVGDSHAAIASFKRAIAIDPMMFESLNNLGTIYFKEGNYEAAEEQFAAALRVKPQATAARFNLGICYAHQGHYDSARREFEEVIRAKPEDAEAYYELALVYEKQGRKDDAIRTLKAARAVASSEALLSKINESLARFQ
jgi:tetratricopeptide (TPR) repeat protein